MNQFEIFKKIKTKSPIFITGYPGIGLVGKLCVEHLAKELKAEKFAEFYSSDFPPQVVIKEDSGISLMKNEYYYVKKKNLEIIFASGDSQALSVAGNYDVSHEILKFAKKHKVKTVITLGGLAIGQNKPDPVIYGAYTDAKLRDKFKRIGVVFTKKTGGIVGAAGLLLGLGNFYGISGVCLMAETHGQFIDANAAKKMCKYITKFLGISVDYKALDKQAKDISKALDQMQQAQIDQQKQFVKDQQQDTMHYIR